MTKLMIALGALCLLAGCQTAGPATTGALCRGPNAIFKDPGFAVQGERLKDKQWIGATQEKGISVCGWQRPKGT
ncbi:MAG: hypothetical protein GC182_08455 [Rhodopseudomonas sp.]|nr:hypothetical protein [Rhodopseudomonas sp.]